MSVFDHSVWLSLPGLAIFANKLRHRCLIGSEYAPETLQYLTEIVTSFLK